MTLLHQIQEITERTYQELSGIKLEEFIIGRQRFTRLTDLARSDVSQLSDIARTFLRVNEDRLYMAIYYSDPMIRVLEKYDPRQGLHEKNIHAFTVFVEELNHAIHAALKFAAGDTDISNEIFIRDLELLAKVDCYNILKFFLAYFNDSRQLEDWDRLWLRHHLFDTGDYSYDSTMIRDRYFETNFLGDKYTRFLDGLKPENRGGEIRRFRSMNYLQKKDYILLLP
ncbi:MAG: hypothetical protein GF372_05975 [Candidatus Marinimicrobia bacterium]|nr:hypothetical protein [Candidatus Neomarinimicrobiota bacterium]